MGLLIVAARGVLPRVPPLLPAGRYGRGAAERALLAARTGPGPRTPAVLLVGLDDFTLVNDTTGHGAGDDLLAKNYRIARATTS